MEQSKELTINVRGLRLRALVWGDEQAPPLLALHGWMDNAMSFSCLAPRLEKRRIIALDFPGHGQSDHRPQGASYFLADYVLDVCHVIDALSIEQCDVIGHSLGAGVATMAAASSERIGRLVLLDGMGPMSTPDTETPRYLSDAITQSLKFRERQFSYPELDDLINRRRQASPELGVEQIERLVRRNARQTDKRWSWRTDPRLKLASPMRFTETAVLTALGKIKSPVMHIGARDGLFASSSIIEKRINSIADMQNHWLGGRHHFHMTDAVSEIAALVNQFLNRSSDAKDQ